MHYLLLLAMAVGAGSPGENPPELSASEIMHRVAENQDREQQARKDFVYERRVHRTLRRKDGRLLRDERWLFSVTPNLKGTDKKLEDVRGRYLKHGKYLPFEGQPVPGLSGLDIILDDPTQSEGRDGFDEELFPLTSDEQKKYAFTRAGERLVEGRAAYRIEFRPTNPRDYGWTGEALIDKEEFQPVSVYTRLSRRLPGAVRTLLGTDVPGLGFNIRYARVEKDLWFPSSYGTEFAIHLLFFMDRTITESTEDTSFRRVTVSSHVAFGNETVPR